MILELVAGAVALGVSASGWIYAYRARGESRDSLAKANEAAERARLEVARADAAEAKASKAEAELAAAAAELRSERANLSATRATLIDERRAKADLIAKLAKAGVPVGPTLIDSSLDRLHADANRRSPQGGDPDGSHAAADDRDREMSDDPPTDPGRKTVPR